VGSFGWLVSFCRGHSAESSTRRRAAAGWLGASVLTILLTSPLLTATVLPPELRWTVPVTLATATTPRPSAVTKKWPPSLCAVASLPSISTSSLPVGSTSDSTLPRTRARTARLSTCFSSRRLDSWIRTLTPSTDISASPWSVRSASLAPRRSPTFAGVTCPESPRSTSTGPRQPTRAGGRGGGGGGEPSPPRGGGRDAPRELRGGDSLPPPAQRGKSLGGDRQAAGGSGGGRGDPRRYENQFRLVRAGDGQE